MIKHLEEFPEIPAQFQHTILEKAFEIAELSHLTAAERADYEISLKHYRDIINVIDTARQEGLAEGEARGRAETLAEAEAQIRRAKEQSAQQMKADGLPVSVISKYTGLACEEIDRL